MKTVDGFKMRKLGREYIVVAEGAKLVNFNKMIVFNETSAFLWDSVVGKEFTVEDLTQLLLGKYDVEPSVAAADALRTAGEWKEAGIVVE